MRSAVYINAAAEFRSIAANRNAVERQSSSDVTINCAASRRSRISRRGFATALHENRVSQVKTAARLNKENTARHFARNKTDVRIVDKSVNDNAPCNDDFRTAELNRLPDEIRAEINRVARIGVKNRFPQTAIRVAEFPVSDEFVM